MVINHLLTGMILQVGIQSASENGNGTYMLRRWLDTSGSSSENMTIDS